MSSQPSQATQKGSPPAVQAQTAKTPVQARAASKEMPAKSGATAATAPGDTGPAAIAAGDVKSADAKAVPPKNAQTKEQAALPDAGLAPEKKSAAEPKQAQAEPKKAKPAAKPEKASEVKPVTGADSKSATSEKKAPVAAKTGKSIPAPLQTKPKDPTGPQEKKRKKKQSLFSKKRRRTLLLILFVFIPTLLLGIYLTFFFSPMYISESYFALRSNESSDMPVAQSVFVSGSSNNVMDAYIIQSHIASHDMLEKVSSRLDLYGHYSDPAKDIYSRLKSFPTREEMLEYWQWLVSVSYELDKGIISVEVKAYTPEMAKAINDAILAFSEELVNQMNDRAHQDAIRLAKDEVAGSEQRVLSAQAKLQQFRDDKSILDPGATAKSLEGVVATLESEAAGVQAELNAALEIMHKNSPRVLTLRTRLNALHGQIAREKTRLAGLNSQSTTLSSLVGDYTQLVTEEKFAQDQLVRSMGALEIARLKAIAKSRYIVPFQPPTLPEESLYPRSFLFTLYGFLILLVLLGLISLVLAAIKDHMGV